MSLGKLTDAELEAMPEKQKRNLKVQPKVLALYRENEFPEAYAKHTDLRIEENGPQAAVGSGDNWDTHGDLQKAFLIKRGLKPNHYLLDFGCGTGRLARKIVPYLEDRHYHGIDLSAKALDCCRDLAVLEGWGGYTPNFHSKMPDPAPVFDFAWAYSVVNHLPLEMVADMMRTISRRLHSTGQFLFTFSNEPVSVRSGLKQFRHTRTDLAEAAASAGMFVKEVENWVQSAGFEPGRWSGGLRIACARRL